MIERLLKKINILASIFLIFFIFGLIIFSCNIEIKDMDLWLHMATGRYILQTHVIPKVDILSATIAGKPWINHEWLFQVIVASLWDSFGPNGLAAMQTVVVVITFLLLLFLSFDRERNFAQLFVLLLSVLVVKVRFTHRPDLFSLLFLSAYIFILSLSLRRRVAVFILFLIQVFWVNMHGFFILGPMLVAVGILSEWIKRKVPLPFEWNNVNRLEDPEYKTLKITFFIVLAACLINPYFIQGLLYPLKVLFSVGGHSRIFFHKIQELAAPIQIKNIFDLHVYPNFKFLIVITFFSFILNFRKIDIVGVILWVAFLAFSLTAVRSLPLFGIAAYVVFLMNYQNISLTSRIPKNLWNDKTRNVVLIILKISMIVWIAGHISRLAYNGYYDFDKLERKSEYGGISLRNFPYKAVDFLKANDIEGNFFNDFNSGAYLLGRRFPNIRVFIDGRTEVYGPEFYKKYSKIMKGNKELLDECIKKYNITAAFLSYVYNPAPQGIMRNFYYSKEWKLVYFKYDAAIFLKDVPKNKDVIREHQIDLSKWKPPVVELTRFGSMNFTPYQNYNRAYALYNLKFYDKAKQEITDALSINPYFPSAYKLLAKIFIKEHDYAKAFENARKSKLDDPYDEETRYLMGLTSAQLGDLKLAKEQCVRFSVNDPKNRKWGLLSALIYAKEGKVAKVFEILKSFEETNELDIDELIMIADTLIEENKAVEAKEVYSMVIKIDPANKEVKDILSRIK